ncbi:WD40 repeat-like protein [Epithele typhae]|uniref:WD40 repeat-like protein n=1 Tax=Epithele typhae TaxID=378194 RepID=UPI002008E74E|nr:WD40 repeat-like protein [Epithele typhae]KAH9928530.1 WD40 repeat-like protein [Epithele typhae]
MLAHDGDGDSALSASLDSPVGPGPSAAPGPGPFNGHKIVAKTNGCAPPPFTNGTARSSSSGELDGFVAERSRRPVARVSLPGSTLYEDSHVDREEFVRLVIQSLRDVGYMESAATLEAESGYIMETPEVAYFRRCILDGSWEAAETALGRLGVSEGDGLWEAKFLLAKQKYLEHLEAGRTTAALHVLRSELAPLNPEVDHLHALSSLMMCSDPADLRHQLGWDGATGTSRRKLLMDLQRYIPSSVMIPQRRFVTLLDQAQAFQQSRCLYHNAPLRSSSYSLYTNHMCERNSFPRVTTAVLQVHQDEVWNIGWSHSGKFLATASKDRSAIIWRIELDKDPRSRAYTTEFVLDDHPYNVNVVSWSLDDSILLTAAEHVIRLYNARTGVCMRVLEAHDDVVTALSWLPDGSGFISGGLDRKIILWDADGKLRNTWARAPIRVTDLMVTPDFTRLVAVGMYDSPSPTSANPADAAASAGGGATGPAKSGVETRIITYDLATKQPETSIQLYGELTSVKISADSQFALINNASENGPSAEIHLLDLNTQQVVRKYSGHNHSKHVIRSCFGGFEGNFVVSGSEDGNVYIWHRDSGTLLEALTGHGEGSVNSVAWNPVNECMFASCSDDKTVRIWETPPMDYTLRKDERELDIDHEMENGNGSGNGNENGVAGSSKGKGKGKGRWDASPASASSSSSSLAGTGPSTSSAAAGAAAAAGAIDGGSGYGLGSTTALF